MKIALIIIVSLAILVALILFSHLKLRVTSNGKLKLKVGVGPFGVRIIPKKEKKKKLSGLSQKKYLSLMDECRKEAEISEKKSEKPNLPDGFENVGETIAFARRVLSGVIRCTKRSECYLRTCRVKIGGDNAAHIALASAAVNKLLHTFVRFAFSETNFGYNEDAFGAECDYTSGKTTVDFDMSVKLRVIDALREIVKTFPLVQLVSRDSLSNKRSQNK